MTGPTGALAESVCFFSCAAVCEKSCCWAVTVLLSRRRSSSSSSSTAPLLGVQMVLLGVQPELLGVHIANTTRSIWLQLHYVTGCLPISSYRSFIPKTTFSDRWYRLHCSLCLFRGRNVFYWKGNGRSWHPAFQSFFLLPVLLLQNLRCSEVFLPSAPWWLATVYWFLVTALRSSNPSGPWTEAGLDKGRKSWLDY